VRPLPSSPLDCLVGGAVGDASLRTFEVSTLTFVSGANDDDNDDDADADAAVAVADGDGDDDDDDSETGSCLC